MQITVTEDGKQAVQLFEPFMENINNAPYDLIFMVKQHNKYIIINHLETRR
jgi:hypothetical protein